MKLAFSMACGVALAAAVALTGCNNDDEMSTTAIAPGAVETTDGECCASKDQCPVSGDTAPGAVSEGSECSSKSDCASQCPVSGDAAPGAVSESSDCSSKKECPSSCQKSG